LYFFFYYPIGVERHRGMPPWATWGLMAFMVALFTFFRFNPQAALASWEWWIYFPQQPWKPGLVFSIFNHAGWGHLIGNLVYLWCFGPSLERVLGFRRFLLLFVFLGIVANFAQGFVSEYLLTRYAGLGVVGASGALSGLMGLFLLRFPAARIRTAWVIFSPLHGLARSGIVGIPSLLAVGAWVLLQIIHAGTSALGGVDGTAYGAHFGGLLLGLLLGLAYRFPREGRIHLRRERVKSRLSKGDFYGAYELIQPLLVGNHPEDLSIAARVSRLVGMPNETRTLYRRAVNSALASNDEFGATEIYVEALRFFPDHAFPEAVQLRLALSLERQGHLPAAQRALAIFMALFPDSEQFSLALMRAARLEEAQDPDRARKLYRSQLERFPQSPYRNLARRALQDLAGA
jgi:membrane associated rhomboid family serine protease